jgi:hypothetical protein
MSIVFLPVLDSFGVLDSLATAVGGLDYLPFQFTAWVMLTLYLIAESFDSEDDEVAEDEDIDERTEIPPINELNREIIFKRLQNYANETFEALATMAHIWLLISVAAVTSAYATTHGLPYLGILIAVFLPIVETKLSQTRFWVLSPSAILAFPMFLVLLPVTIVAVVFAALGGLIISLSQTLQDIVTWALTRLIRFFHAVDLTTPFFGAFEETFSRSQRR